MPECIRTAVPPPQNFFSNFYLKMVSFGAFWVAFYVIESYNYKIAKGRTVADARPEKRGFSCLSGRVLVCFGRVQYSSGTNFKMTDYTKLSSRDAVVFHFC